MKFNSIFNTQILDIIIKLGKNNLLFYYMISFKHTGNALDRKTQNGSDSTQFTGSAASFPDRGWTGVVLGQSLRSLDRKASGLL